MCASFRLLGLLHVPFLDYRQPALAFFADVFADLAFFLVGAVFFVPGAFLEEYEPVLPERALFAVGAGVVFGRFSPAFFCWRGFCHFIFLLFLGVASLDESKLLFCLLACLEDG
jgi:hypothetical protein